MNNIILFVLMYCVTSNIGIPNDPNSTLPRKCSECSCGVANKYHKIVGGFETNVKNYPWMAALTYFSSLKCGASVINSNYLLSAGHCVAKGQRKHYRALFLFQAYPGIESETISKKIDNIIVHPHYNHITHNNDIALLLIRHPLNFDGILKPVCLPTTEDNYSNKTGIAVGWGRTTEGGSTSDHLREVHVPILSNKKCNETIYNNRITEKMLCAGLPEGTRDTCQGDSGGPLHIYNDDRYTIVGIVSWGDGCGQPNRPGVYTRVTEFLDWIWSVAENVCTC